MVSLAAWLSTAGAFLLVLLGEGLHARRVRRIARLAFGPGQRPSAWVFLAPWLRSLAAAALAFGLVNLLELPPKTHHVGGARPDDPRHLIILLDVSPSMRLADAGPAKNEQRNHRARDLLMSLFQRIAVGNYAISVVSVYNGAKPVVVDTHDSAVIDNVLGDLPMHLAFQAGKTKLFDGIAEAARIAKPWKPGSAILAILSDGDTVPATGMPDLPPSIGSVLVVGVGDPVAGRFIDGKQSRQDVSTLRQVATRLHGVYHDGNLRQIPSDVVREITETAEGADRDKLTLREYALLAIAAGAALLAGLPLLLHYLGTSWQPGVRRTSPHPVPGSREALLPEVRPAR